MSMCKSGRARARILASVCVCVSPRACAREQCVYVHLPRKCFHRRWFYRCVSAMDRHVFVGLREDLAPRGCSCAAFEDPTVIF